MPPLTCSGAVYRYIYFLPPALGTYLLKGRKKRAAVRLRLAQSSSLAHIAVRQVTALPLVIGGIPILVDTVRPIELLRLEGGGGRLALSPRLPTP